MLRHSTKVLLIVAAWTAAIAGSAMLDAAVARAVRTSGLERYMRSHDLLRAALKTPGEYWFTAAVIAAVWFHRRKWRACLLLLGATVLSGVNGVIKWIAGRARPFKTFTGDSPLLTPFQLHPFPDFSSKNLCFPSGHVSLAFATAAALSILLPRWRWWFYAGAVLVAAERVAENAHWLSDVVAAAALGVGCVWIVRRIWWNDGSTALSVAGDSGLQRAGEHPHAA